MPIYTFRCPSCSVRQDAFRKIAERNDCPACEKCGGPTERRITATMVSVFQPYMTVAFDKETGKPMHIRNQDEHRAFLQRNGFEEVGNDPSVAPPSFEEFQARREQKLKEQAADPDFQFNDTTQEAIA